MVQYIYFVKCPDCEDEHFDFFDEAKEFAMSCLTKKPIITQIEVDRNDFGECVDSCDLGTVWSWEEVMKDVPAEPEATVFSKADTFGCVDCDTCSNGNCVAEDDPEFAALDNSLDFVPDDFRKSLTESDRIDIDDRNKITKEELYDLIVNKGKFVNLAGGTMSGYDIRFNDGAPYSDSWIEVHYHKSTGTFSAYEWTYSSDGDSTDGDYSFETTSFDVLWDELTDVTHGVLIENANNKKPIPADKTIESLVEEMEENEDEVECKWCGELFGKDECRYEVDLGYLCGRCEAAIKSRGEALTFRESYGLDEKIDIDFSNCVDSSDMEIYGVEPIGEDTYKAVLLKRYEKVSYKGPSDATQDVYDEMYDIDGAFTFGFTKDNKPELLAWNVNLLRNLGDWEILFDDKRYEQACEKAWHGSASKEEGLDHEIVHDLGNEYDGGYPANEYEAPEIEKVSEFHLALCPECGDETFDHETGVCINCGFH